MSEPITYAALRQHGFLQPFEKYPARFSLEFTFTLEGQERTRFLHLVRGKQGWAVFVSSYNAEKITTSIAIARLEDMLDVRRMLLALQIKRGERRVKLRIKRK